METDAKIMLGRLAGTQELLLAEFRIYRAEATATFTALEKRVSGLEDYKVKVASFALAAATLAGAIIKYLPDIVAHLHLKDILS